MAVPGHIFVVLLSTISINFGFNIDTHIPVIKQGPTDSYFGYAVAQHVTEKITNPNTVPSFAEFVLLVGAPKFNDTGALYRCNAQSKLPDCQTVPNLETAIRKKDVTTFRDIWMGSTVSTYGTGNKVLVCAHRFAINYVGIGTCVSLNSDLSPDAERRACSDDGRENQGVAYCQAGTAGLLMEDDSILLGAPGAADWTGGLFKHDIADSLEADPTWYKTPFFKNPEDGIKKPPIAPTSYMGFAVTTGRFDSSGQNYVGGAPRSNATGLVVLFYMDVNNRLTYRDDQVLEGELAFAAFGYSLLAVDLNNDGFDELIVGSPMHLEKNAGGAIFIYKGGSRITQATKPKKILGKKDSEDECMKYNCQDARFGFALSKIGDINRDGYQDFVVGAPYEGGNIGAIYIYHGSENGEVNMYSQRIYGQNLDMRLQTFGFSLSGGLDMDRNGYPDILVGAYESSNAIMLRTRPIITLDSSVAVAPNQFNLSEKPYCRQDFTTNYCIELALCLSYSVFPARNFVEVDYKIEADIGRINKRVVFADKDNSNAAGDMLMATARIDTGLNKCIRKIVYLKANFQDKLRPIQFNITYGLPKENWPSRKRRQADNLPDINMFPVLQLKGDQADATTVVSTVVKFAKKCGANDVCESNLIMQADIDLSKEEGIPILEDIGSDRPISVIVSLQNMQEPAYETMMYFTVPSSFEYIDTETIEPNGFSPSCGVFDKTTLACSGLGNPLLAGEEYKFKVKFDATKLDPTIREFNITAVVNTTSTEQTPAGDTQVIIVKVITRANVILSGTAQPDRDILYSGEVIGESAITVETQIGPAINHTYRVTNEGPGSIGSATLTIQWPYEMAGRKPGERGKRLLYLTKRPIFKSSSVVVDCSDNPDSIFNELNYETSGYSVSGRKRRQSGNEVGEADDSENKSDKEDNKVRLAEQRESKLNVITLDCEDSSVQCHDIKCKISSLSSDKFVDIIISGRIWQSTLLEDYPKADMVKIVSRGRVTLDPSLNIQQKNIEDDESSATTYAIPDLLVTTISQISWWIILVAVLGGLILLVILILIFWKIGFFKRIKPENYEPTYKGEVTKNEKEKDAFIT